jgi:LPS-assembly lipoprotein
LHGNRSQAGTTATDLAYVTVAPIPQRNGQLVRNELIELLRKAGPQGQPVFRLDVQVNEAREGLAFSRDDSVTRYNLRMNAAYRLIDERSGDSILQGQARAIAAYNVVQSDYANLIAERDARERAARVLAENIRTRLAVFFSNASS